MFWLGVALSFVGWLWLVVNAFRQSAMWGIGSLLISAILSNDTPVIMAVTFVFACLVVLFNLIADVLYGWLDPRISLR